MLRSHDYLITSLELFLDYDFKMDADWLSTEGCPVTAKMDSKHHDKILERAGLTTKRRKRSLLGNGTRKLVKTFQRLSSRDGR
jgi:hypothetical protein